MLRSKSVFVVAGKSMFELSKRLLGPEGSTVSLSMQRFEDNSTYAVTIVRKEMIRKAGACSGEGTLSASRLEP